MKRIISIALVALMLVALALPVVAALPDGSTISSNKQENHLTNDVTVIVNKKTDGGQPVITYKVDINWSNLEFAYTNAEWDAGEGCYTNGSWATIDGEDAQKGRPVTVTNYSNNGVSVKATLSSSVNQGVTATLENDDFDLGSAAAASGTTTGTFYVKVSGNPKADSFTIGTITVSLTPAAIN